MRGRIVRGRDMRRRRERDVNTFGQRVSSIATYTYIARRMCDV